MDGTTPIPTNKMSKLHLETGHPVTADGTKIKGERFRFADDEGRTVFEIVAKEGYIEVRAVEFHKIGDSIHGGGLAIYPRASNEVEIRTQFYSRQ